MSKISIIGIVENLNFCFPCDSSVCSIILIVIHRGYKTQHQNNISAMTIFPNQNRRTYEPKDVQENFCVDVFGVLYIWIAPEVA